MDEQEEQIGASMPKSFETQCWGCGLSLQVNSYSSKFKCGWCGALTVQTPHKYQKHRTYRWRRFLDRFLVTFLTVFMLLVISGGVWAVYPVVFSISFLCGTFHSVLTFLLSVATLSSYFSAAFQFAGPPPDALWGSYPVVGKDTLENYTYCIYCARPKSPRTHHCRTCGTCVLDMDHHCPFIGNCVGATNHRAFLIFLISTILSTMYTCAMCAFAAFRISSSGSHESAEPHFFYTKAGLFKLFTGILYGLLNYMFLSSRVIVLLYLFVVSISVQAGLIVLLVEQLKFIYHGQTYIGSLSSSDVGNREEGLHNILNFFACPLSVSRFVLPDARKKSHSK